ncbi:MAG: efflux RND transporter periplasmic adaptor subunit [Alphaproteobacteria bacterium]|nr:efflux RND transporter periplasmic adaptor subunit [Alphaproteobacteria bacterium]MDP6564185.1 efflux RND transporter periplasmic adaptor subunit [Alphaproteobacteria bacterium]MDP6815701.1 efflux RND transporter periplasmic adaptor subunit [Alphaproteobacteria bacterium]
MTYPWWRRALIVIPLALGAAVLAYFVLNQQAPEVVPARERVQMVRLITAAEVDVVPKVLGYGTVRADRVWSAVARVSGEVAYVHPNFKNGAILAAGTEIIRISPTDYELQISQAGANIRATEARIAELAATERNHQRSLKIEKQSLALKEKQLVRTRALRKRGTIAQASLEAEENAVLGQRQRVQEIENALTLIPAQIAAQNEQKAVYQAQLSSAELSLARTHTRLPFNARIAQSNVERTQYVQTGTVMGSADSIERAEVEAQIPQALFQRFIGAVVGDRTVGQVDGETLSMMAREYGLAARVRLPFGQPGIAWQGRVVRISDTIDPQTRTVGAVVAVDDPYGGVRPGERPPLVKGMFVEVALHGKPLRRRILVPRSALRQGRLYLMTAEGRLAIRPVETAYLQGDLAVIGAGLAPGERVVVSDLLYASEGMLLEGVEDGDLAARLRAAAAADGAVK